MKHFSGFVGDDVDGLQKNVQNRTGAKGAIEILFFILLCWIRCDEAFCATFVFCELFFLRDDFIYSLVDNVQKGWYFRDAVI